MARLFALATILTAVAACAPIWSTPPLVSAASSGGPEIHVEGVPTRLVIGRNGLTKRRFIAALGEIGGGRFDALHLELRGSERAALRAVAAEARRAGVDPLKIGIVPGGTTPGLVEVTVTRFVATVPVCPSLAIIDPSVEENDFEPTLGCSTRRNLAAMANDPADLLGNSTIVPSDGAAASHAIERYRNGPGGQRGVGQGMTDPAASSMPAMPPGGGTAARLP